MKCQFGELAIRTPVDGTERQLLLNNQVQGASFLIPPSTSVSTDARPGPGPISACAYSLGWLLAGYQHPNASMVMVGLGSGAGAIQLLYCCPDVDLTIVEVCQEVIDLATDSFPLLDYYQNIGRLHIVHADAAEFFEKEQRWLIGLADAYTGLTNEIEASYLRRMHDRCDRLYLNIIDRLDGPTMMIVEDWLESENTPVTEIYRADNVLRGKPIYESPGNWIMTNDLQFPGILNIQRPFEIMPDCEAKTFALANWAALLDNARSANTDGQYRY